MIASMSAAFAAPRGLTMKFACFSDTRASPTRVALEAAALDQPRRVIARRVAEDAAGIRQIERLRGDAPAQQLRDPLARGATVARRKREPRRGEDAVRRAAVGAAHRAVAGRVRRRRLALRSSRRASALPRGRRSATSRRRSSRRSSPARRRRCRESRPGIRRRRSRASPRIARPWGSPRRLRRRSGRRRARAR